MMPGSDPSGTGGSAIRRGGRLNAIKTATAAARAAVRDRAALTTWMRESQAS